MEFLDSKKGAVRRKGDAACHAAKLSSLHLDTTQE